MAVFWNDAKYALRQLRKSPGFTAVAVLSLALGIGADTAVFSVVDAVVLRALPYPEPDQLVRLSIAREGRSGSVSYPFFEDWRRQSHSFTRLAAFKYREMDFISAGGPECLEGASVSQDFFDMLGAAATLARRAWPNQDPIGRHIMLGGHQTDDLEKAYEVIGVVADIHHGSLSEEVGPGVYFLYPARASERNLGFILRCDIDPVDVIPAVRSTIWELDAALPISELTTMNQRIAQTFSRQRFALIFLAIAGTVALTLVVVGVYGVVSYVVSRRTRELGLRMALGASQGRVMLSILRKGSTLAVTGSALGIVGAWGLTRFLSGALYGVSHTDPATFVLVPVLLIGITLLACYVPARRAAKTNPMEALRHE